MTQYAPIEIGRGALGAAMGIASAGLVAALVPGGPELLPVLVAPMGASAVLLFAVPASPLAQPWPVLGGNVISTLIGLAAHRWIPGEVAAAAIAVGVAIGTMMVARCLHPPGGACALLAASATPVIEDQGWAFVALPVALNTVVLLLVAVAVNDLSGRRYPHRAPAIPPSTRSRLSLDSDDVAGALEERARTAQRLDVVPGDVLALVREAEDRALDRRLGSLPVAAIMHSDVAVLQPFESIYRARTVITSRGVKTLPVVDEERHVIGVVSIIDLFTRDLVELDPIETIMGRDVVTVPQETPVAALVGQMTQDGFKNIPVVDVDDRLVGMITRGDLLAVLHRALVAGST